jgi:dihydrofolate reductase
MLSYSAIASLDGYINDETGTFQWSAPDEEVHAFVNDLERDVGTYLYGRRLYDVMVFWETLELEGEPDVMRDYAQLWRAAEKVVYSRTLAAPRSERTRIEREFDADAVRALPGDVSVGGAELASHALRAGVVDECRVLLAPVIVGAGTPWLPAGFKQRLELLEERRFKSGVVYLRYRTRRA